ncbi:MAG: AAA family ATPase [Chitinispirillia bacterium]|nr:AAA family ATPase [Chitinispirillia bacterium]MCL2242797.1 AAA family ATPase [Chitinispirillia bacterium]
MNSLITIVRSLAQQSENSGTNAACQLPANTRRNASCGDGILGDEQRYVYERMEGTAGTMFVTGKAGTGKSFLLKYFKENSRKKIAVVAPTGAAAINVGGQTIHSFFHLAPDVQIPENIEPITSTRLLRLLRCVETIVIDEVSMVRVDLMDMIDTKLRLANENALPFGGKQVIMFGDPYQLPPVVDDDGIRDYLMNTYRSEFFFAAPVFKERPLATYELSKVYRQGADREFIDLLNKVRDGSVDTGDIAGFNKKCVRRPDEGQLCLTLVPTNAAANWINSEKLRKIDAPQFMYQAEITGKITQSEYPTEVDLKLKAGALVVMLENRDGWVNGSLGIVSYLDNDFVRVTINGTEHTIDKKVWEKKKYSYDHKTKSLTNEIIATFKQYPVKLAWALTIHKAQGQTYKTVAIDMGSGAFESGQAYVALSRCVSMDTLYLLKPIRYEDIKVSADVVEFMRPAGGGQHVIDVGGYEQGLLSSQIQPDDSEIQMVSSIRRGEAEGIAKKLKAIGVNAETIAAATGLAVEEVFGL